MIIYHIPKLDNPVLLWLSFSTFFDAWLELPIILLPYLPNPCLKPGHINDVQCMWHKFYLLAFKVVKLLSGLLA